MNVVRESDRPVADVHHLNQNARPYHYEILIVLNSHSELGDTGNEMNT
jgi:hypothetical protein